MTNPLLSICIPLRVTHHTRLRNWNAVYHDLAQLAKRRGDIEIVVAERGGQHAAGLEFVRRLHVTRPFTRSIARNTAWLAASADLLCFHDADMLLDPRSWDASIDAALQCDVLSPYRSLFKLGPHKTERLIVDGKYNWKDRINPVPESRTKQSGGNIAGGICFMKRDFIEQVGGWDERFLNWGYEDGAMDHLIRKGGFESLRQLNRAVHLWHKKEKAGSRHSHRLKHREYVGVPYQEIVEEKKGTLARNYKRFKNESSSPKVTAVLNTYARPQNFQRQVQAIENQTISPSNLMVWSNKSHLEFDSEALGELLNAKCSGNIGVWARFAFALNATTEFVCVFDDDTIPGQEWFENCIETMKTHEGLLGAAGVIFNTPRSYYPNDWSGWRKPSDDVKQVDIVGHAWFFRREWLGMFWSEMPTRRQNRFCGEDFHFSYMLQKHGINTYTPPHPPDNKEKWGSIDGMLGTDSVALSQEQTTHQNIKDGLPFYVSKGFRLLCQTSTFRESQEADRHGDSTSSV